eukprot:3104567-Amphidinium_carterae.1
MSIFTCTQTVVRINGSVTVSAVIAIHRSRSDTIAVSTRVGVSQKVMSEISQRIRSVIRFVIKVTMKRNQRKFRS